MTVFQYDNRRLNVLFLHDRISQLGLKQWWIADQIGVHRKTLTRWVTGTVGRIQPENLERLAQCLQCSAADLVLRDGEVLATKAEALEAARLIEREALIETLGPLGQWRMLEVLIRATLQPEIPLSTLGQLYN